MGVHYNSLTRESYLQLPAPCANIIITPHREHQIEETAAAMTEILNDPRVNFWLQGPPYPFLLEHGQDWVRKRSAENKALLSILQQEFEISRSQQQSNSPSGQEKQEFFDQCPFVCIREVTKRDSETGAPLQDVLIGDFTLSRYAFYEMQPNSQELTLAQEQNSALPAGHKDIVWGVGSMIPIRYSGMT